MSVATINPAHQIIDSIESDCGRRLPPFCARNLELGSHHAAGVRDKSPVNHRIREIRRVVSIACVFRVEEWPHFPGPCDEEIGCSKAHAERVETHGGMLANGN